MGFPKHFKGFFFSNFVQYHSLNLRGSDADFLEFKRV